MVTSQYVFPTEIANIILAEYKAGKTLYFHSHSFMLGPTYTIVQNAIPGVIQINLGFDSLKAVLLAYIPKDYEQYSYCRRQFRLSMNITKLQCKIGMDYYPSIPALANGGNVAPLQSQSNFTWQRPNNEYVIELLKAFGKYNDVTEDSFINNVNFAINDRAFSPDNSQTMSSVDRNGYTYQECFCQKGWPLVHENRWIGKAVYGMDLETLNKESPVLSGINTTNVKPFEFYQEYQSDTSTQFNGNAILYPFMWYDFVIAVNTAGVTVVGRT